MVTRTNSQGLANLVLATIVWILFLLALAAILGSRRLFSQSAGAVRTQEIYSSTHHVKVDNSINTPVVAVTYAASTTFDANLGEHFTETLTGNVTSSTLSNAVAGANYFFSICQDATGNRTFAWPSNFQNAPTIVATASKCTNVVGFYDGTNFDITGQWNTASGGAGTGTVTSVGLLGDGTIYNSTAGACGGPVTSTGTFNLANCIKSVQSGYVLAGPVASLGSNVAFRQMKACAANGGTSGTCAFTSNIVSGNIILVLGLNITNFNTPTDTMGNTFSTKAALNDGYYSYATASSSGADTVSWTASSSNAYSKVFIMEISGVSGFHSAANCFYFGNATNPNCSTTLSPSATTDGIIELAATSSDTGQTSAGYSVNPVASLATSYSVTTTEPATYVGNLWVYAPGSTSTQTLNFYGNDTGNGVRSYGFAFDFLQSSSASSNTPIYRQLTEGDLPPTAISALQSVQTFNMSSTTIVIDATTPNTGTSLISGTVTMPTQGCPCRVMAYYSVYWDETGTGDTFDFWLSDGTNQFATAERNVVSAAGPGVNSGGISPGAYSNNQAVTFTLYGASGSTSSGTARKAAANTVATELSHITLAIVQSRN